MQWKDAKDVLVKQKQLKYQSGEKEVRHDGAQAPGRKDSRVSEQDSAQASEWTGAFLPSSKKLLTTV
jgi:hypothetical protein